MTEPAPPEFIRLAVSMAGFFFMIGLAAGYLIGARMRDE